MASLVRSRQPAESRIATPSAISYLEPDAPHLLGQVVRHIIDATLEVEPAIEPVSISNSQWPTIWNPLVRHRTASLLEHAVGDGRVRIGEDQTRQLRESAAQTAILQLRLCQSTREVVALLADNGIEVRVLKGIATALLDYPIPGLRHTSDVDLICSQNDFPHALAVLSAAGHRRLRADDPYEVLVESTFKTDDGIELDLHHRLFRFGDGYDAVFEAGTLLPEECGLAMSLELRLLHAAGHLLISPPGHRQMSSLIDVALLEANPELDERRLGEHASHARVVGLVGFARWLAHSVGLDDPPPRPAIKSSLINRACIRTERSLVVETAAVLWDLKNKDDRIKWLRYQLRKLGR